MEIRGFFSRRDTASAQIWQFAGNYGVATSRFSGEFPNIYWPGRFFARIRGPTSFYILSQKGDLKSVYDTFNSHANMWYSLSRDLVTKVIAEGPFR